MHNSVPVTVPRLRDKSEVVRAIFPLFPIERSSQIFIRIERIVDCVALEWGGGTSGIPELPALVVTL